MRYQYPLPTDHPAEPAPLLDTLCQREPVAPVVTATGENAWLVTRYEQVQALFADSRLCARFPGMQISGEDVAGLAESTDIMLMKDGAEHARLRGLVSRGFSARYIEGLRGMVGDRADRTMDAMTAAGPPADLTEGFLAPFVSGVTSEMLAIQVEDRDEFHYWAKAVMASAASKSFSHEDVSTAILNLLVFASKLIADRRENPGDDLFSELISIYDEKDGRLTDGELLGLAVTLMIAGFLPTVSALAHGVLLLLAEPERYTALRDDPALIPGAVDELVRFQSTDGDPMRVAKEDITVAGVTIKADDLVILSRCAANRDPRVFPHPHEFRLDRDNNPHLAFGYGPHYCLGSGLARLQLQTALECLVRRLPGLRLAGSPADIEWFAGTFFAMPATLPVAW